MDRNRRSSRRSDILESLTMKHALCLLAALAILAAPAAAQTIKALGYNTTNGQVVAATNVVWTNSFNFSTNTVAAQVRTNLGLGLLALTNTNVTNFRTAVGVGATNAVTFGSLDATTLISTPYIESPALFIPDGGGITFEDTGTISFNNAAGSVRASLGLPLAALTNTSNVTAMRALSGSTNTNTPFSGSVSLTNTNTLVFSNGILQSTQ